MLEYDLDAMLAAQKLDEHDMNLFRESKSNE